MPVNQLLAAAQVTLPLDEIQGDVLIGLKKNVEVFAFFEIDDDAAFRPALRAVLDDITFSDQVRDIEEAKQQGPVAPQLGLNIAFTATGLGKLFPGDALSGLDASFLAGAAARAGALGDNLADWADEYREGFDGVLLITAIDEAAALAHAGTIALRLGDCVRVVRQELGRVRAAARGHEHFGFADGISQPGVRGLTAPGPDRPDEGLPGQDLVAPGEFLLGGYAREGAPPVAPPRPWMADGAYMVFRRLNQDVRAFADYVADNAAGPTVDDAERLGAQLIGRWRSGAPLVVSPVRDDGALGADPERNNDFDFAVDQHQGNCPFAAHIRKVYPREDFHDEAEKRRIIRAGIPFGRDQDADKGLLFVCYQNSISDKFEFLQIAWANNPDFVFGKTNSAGAPITPGRDIVIGQGDPRQIAIGDTPRTLPPAPAFVTATGGAYLFAPSRTALRAIAEG